MNKYHHIVSDPAVLGGKPCIKGTRISVDMILEWLASGASISGIIERFPHLTEEGIRQALWYAADAIKQEVVIIQEVGK